MAKFIFKFQSLMNVKEKLKEQKEVEFGKAVQNYEIEKNKLNDIDSKKTQAIVQLKANISNRVSAREVFEYNAYIDKLKKDSIAQHKNIQKAEQEVERVRVELSEAIMEIKKYEKLKEKDLSIYNEEIKQKENAFVDEIVTYKFTKKDEE